MLKFMDFCAGIGGGRLGLELNGLTCVAHCEIDPNPAYTYSLFYNDNNNFGDLTQINPEELPDFDILIGGFPCQTFSIVGKRAGFDDNRGNIVFELINIMIQKNVKGFILENVKGLVNHDKGRTLQLISEALFDAGYDFEYKVVNSLECGVPQMRERIYLVGIKNDMHEIPFKWPEPVAVPDIRNYLVGKNNRILPLEDITFQKYLNNKYNKGRIDINEVLKQDYLVLDTRQSDLRVYEGKCPTLRTGRHGILYVKDGKLLRLSGYEALLLQGFPVELAEKAYSAKILDSKLLGQAGNAMTVNVIRNLGKSLLECMGLYIDDMSSEEFCIKKGGNQMNFNDLVERGSQTARDGFANEHDVANKFNNWETDKEAQHWLNIMQYKIEEIDYVKAVVLHGYKADINCQVQIKLKNALDIENIQVKLVSNKKGFNQVDKRWLESYNRLWNIPSDVYRLLQYFTGEISPYRSDTKDSRRMFLNEMTEQERDTILNWFRANKVLILSDIIRGRGEFSAEWVLVAQKVTQNSRWVLKNINEAIQHYSIGPVEMSPRGSINIGKVGVQRKGGDNGRDTANMLQFKLDPTELFDI